MKTTLNFATVVLAASCSLQAATVYDNTSINLNTRLSANTLEIGDQILLAGTERSLTSFSFQYYLLTPSAGDETLRLRFYGQDGPSGRPGTLLFDSGTFGVPATAGSLVEITDFASGAALPLSSLLPDVFTWSLTFGGIGAGESAGVNLFGGPTVGNSFVDYWENDGSSWVNKRVDFGDPLIPTDFAATVQAVPEPSTVALAVIGAAALLWRRRTRKEANS